MPNDCWCDVRIGAHEETIQMLVEAKFSFEKLRPKPQGVDWYDWCIKNWGTKWDRYEYKVVRQGQAGLELRFTTAWVPPFTLFDYLVETYHDIWIRCDWSEEGGKAGVYVSRWNSQKNKAEVVNTAWMDWPMDEYMYRMANDDTKSYFHRPRTHCKDEREYNLKRSQMAITTTVKEYRELTQEITIDYQQIKGRNPSLEEIRCEVIRRKANILWPEYAHNNQELTDKPSSPTPPSPTPVEMEEALLESSDEI